MAKNCVGLDIGSSSVKMVQLRETRRGNPLLVAFGLEPIPPQTIVDGTIMNQGAVVDAIRAVYERLRLRRKDVALAISGHSVIIKKISVPVMTPEELEEQIPWEAEHHIPFSKDDVDIDHQVLNPGNAQGQMEVLLVAAKKEVVNDYTAVARDAQLHPLVVDVASFSLQNAFELNYAHPPNETVALVNIGASVSNLNVLAGGLSAFTRDVTIGGNAFTEEIQKQLGVGHDEAEAYKVGGSSAEEHGVVPKEVERVMAQVAEVLAGELQRSLDFYLATSTEANLSRIYLSGGTAKIPTLARAVTARSRVPVELLDPFRQLYVDEGRFDMAFLRSHAPEAAVAVGLAIRRPGDGA